MTPGIIKIRTLKKILPVTARLTMGMIEAG
jgi:hypothetical protein